MLIQIVKYDRVRLGDYTNNQIGNPKGGFMKILKNSVLLLIIIFLVILNSACKKSGKEEITTMSESTGIQVGLYAPDIEAMATNDENVKFSDLKGSWVILYFYPKAFTGG